MAAVNHTIRSDGDGNTKTVSLTARRAIRTFCKECVGFNPHEVRKCTDSLCPLFPFRTADTPVGTPVSPVEAFSNVLMAP